MSNAIIKKRSLKLTKIPYIVIVKMLQEILTVIQIALIFTILNRETLLSQEKMKYFLQVQYVNIKVDCITKTADFSITSSPVSVVYMTCFDKVPINSSKFTIPSYKISCSKKGPDDDECFEAVPYLQFIYDHYYSSGKYIFIHGHEYSWHNNNNKDSVYDVINKRMKSQQFQKDQYGTLFSTLPHYRPTWKLHPIENELFYLIYHNTSMMEYANLRSTHFYCCAQFFVNASLFRKRPREEYKIFIDRLKEYSHTHINITKGPGFWCGRIMEYTWHLLLGHKVYVSYNNN